MARVERRRAAGGEQRGRLGAAAAARVELAAARVEQRVGANEWLTVDRLRIRSNYADG